MDIDSLVDEILRRVQEKLRESEEAAWSEHKKSIPGNSGDRQEPVSRQAPAQREEAHSQAPSQSQAPAHSQVASYIEEAASRREPLQRRGTEAAAVLMKRVLTEQDMISVCSPGLAVLHVSRRAILTDLAKDYAKARRVEVVRDR